MQLTLKPQWKFVEKAIQTKDGRDAIAFIAVLSAGDVILSFRVIDVRIVEASSVASTETLKLSTLKIKSPAPVSIKQTLKKVVSPYFDTLSILVSQPTRAPSTRI
jgi:hypothetical protein